jgi:transaldolase
LYLDSADLADFRRHASDPRIKGFTTNPALMYVAGVRDYREFAARAVEMAKGRPISFEVLADDLAEIERQARAIVRWGRNVLVKVPITTSRGEPTAGIQRRLVAEGAAVNVTAITTLDQVSTAAAALAGSKNSVVSIFAGRVADTGRDPVPLMLAARTIVDEVAGCRLLWGSIREVYNMFQAAGAGCDIITVTAALLDKLSLIGKDLTEMSLQTVEEFARAADKAGYVV